MSRLPAPLRIGLGGDRTRRRRALVGRPSAPRARSELPRVADRRAGGGAGRRHGCGEPVAVRGAGDGRGAPLRRGRAARASAARAAGRTGASAGRRARAPGAPGRPARARDRLRRARVARATRHSRRPARERILARRRPAGRDRWRRRPAAHGDRATRSRSGPSGERRALVVGVVLGADEGIDPDLRDAFKASGLYHLLAVSGQNIVFIGFGVLGLAYVAGLGRPIGHTLAILAILAYALAVGWQPSVVRAAVAGCLASLAWLLSRPSDRWHTMAMGAVVLLAWTPRSLLEPGFQLSFAAVAAIFLAMPRLRRWQEGYPVPAWLVEVVGISAACGIVTAPILWLQFGTIPLWTVPANALAEPAMPVLLGCGLGAAVARARDPARRRRALVARGARRGVDRVLGPARRVAALRADLVRHVRRSSSRSRSSASSCSGRSRRTGGARSSSRPSRSCRSLALGWWALHPAALVVAAGRAARLVSRRRPGRRDPARDAAGRDARRRRAARGARRPAAPADGPARARRDRDHARTPRPRRWCPRRPAHADGRGGDRSDAAGPGLRRADAARDRPPPRRAARPGTRGEDVRARTPPAPRALARPRRLAGRESHTSTAPSCSRATARSTFC